MNRNIFISLILSVSITFFMPLACTMLPATRSANSKLRNANEAGNIKKKLVEGANKYLGAKKLVVNDRTFNMDCSGVVCAIYYYAGIDMQEYYPKYTGTGTERIYSALKDNKLLKKNWLPEPGDIIFWDNTFDKNENKKNDDLLTHMGMVVSCDKSGNITYIHFHYSKGIVYEYMNIRYRDNETKEIAGKTVTINSPIRIKGGSKVEQKLLSGQLFNSFGEGYYLK